MKKQQGFTLIELMIVVAIIGILAAVAIPAYTDYMKRGKVSEAVTLLGGMKTMAEEYRASRGVFPGGDTANPDTVVTPDQSAIYDFTQKTGGKYTTGMQIVKASADEFVVEIGFIEDPDLDKGVVALGISYIDGLQTDDGAPLTGKFTCRESDLVKIAGYSAPGGSYTTAPEGYTDTKYLPSTCR